VNRGAEGETREKTPKRGRKGAESKKQTKDSYLHWPNSDPLHLDSEKKERRRQDPHIRENVHLRKEQGRRNKKKKIYIYIYIRKNKKPAIHRQTPEVVNTATGRSFLSGHALEYSK
jgi:hypothetical protein